MRSTLLPASLLLTALLTGGAVAAAQSPTAVWERDEYGFPSISCGAGRVTFEYESRSGEKIVIEGRKYESIASADEALERSLWTAVKVLAREGLVNKQGDSTGRRVVAKFADKAVRLERKGVWLYSTEASSLESLLKFEAYEKKNRHDHSATPPKK